MSTPPQWGADPVERFSERFSFKLAQARTHLMAEGFEVTPVEANPPTTWLITLLGDGNLNGIDSHDVELRLEIQTNNRRKVALVGRVIGLRKLVKLVHPFEDFVAPDDWQELERRYRVLTSEDTMHVLREAAKKELGRAPLLD